jgi:aminoglycoside phosphotransferase family enzyme/predicted kinase
MLGRSGRPIQGQWSHSAGLLTLFGPRREMDDRCMSAAASMAERVDGSTAAPGDLQAQVRETHTGLVVLVGERAFKIKKRVVTDFLDFSTAGSREQACKHEVALNRRLSPDSYLGVGHFTEPGTGATEPVIVMRRYPDSSRLASLVASGAPVHDHLDLIARRLSSFHRDATRNAAIDRCGTSDAISRRWHDNLTELQHHVGTAIEADVLSDVRRLVDQFIAGRATLFTQRLADHRVVDGHADLLADDIFCQPGHLAILDCLEFDDELRYVDTVDDAAFLAMDLEFLGREDLGEHFISAFLRASVDPAPKALCDFYIAYRAVVRAKVDCVRIRQGHAEAAIDARRHLAIALKHLRSGTVQLIVVGGGPGTGKSTLAGALAEARDAEVISTDAVRAQMRRAGIIAGATGDFEAGLYSPANVEAVYHEVLSRASTALRAGKSVILDGTWRDPGHREEARAIASRSAAPMVELTCSVPLDEAAVRIVRRPASTSDATPEIAAAMSEPSDSMYSGHVIDTTRPLAESVEEAQQICCLAI